MARLSGSEGRATQKTESSAARLHLDGPLQAGHDNYGVARSEFGDTEFSDTSNN
jgi:hypothetical protein